MADTVLVQMFERPPEGLRTDTDPHQYTGSKLASSPSRLTTTVRVVYPRWLLTSHLWYPNPQIETTAHGRPCVPLPFRELDRIGYTRGACPASRAPSDTPPKPLTQPQVEGSCPTFWYSCGGDSYRGRAARLEVRSLCRTVRTEKVEKTTRRSQAFNRR